MSKTYWEIMDEPLPKAEDYGFDCDGAHDPLLIEKADAFRRTEGHWRWQIAMSGWMIRRQQAELDRQAGSKGAYAEWVRRNNPHAIAYERERIVEYEQEIEDIRKGSAA